MEFNTPCPELPDCRVMRTANDDEHTSFSYLAIGRHGLVEVVAASIDDDAGQLEEERYGTSMDPLKAGCRS